MTPSELDYELSRIGAYNPDWALLKPLHEPINLAMFSDDPKIEINEPDEKANHVDFWDWQPPPVTHHEALVQFYEKRKQQNISYRSSKLFQKLGI